VTEIHVVTGGAGFLGAHICRAILSQASKEVVVICVDNLVTGSMANIRDLLDGPRFRFVLGDAAVALPGGAVVPPGRVTHVWALAALASPRAYFARPMETAWAGAEAHRRTLEFAAAHGARVLYTSTSEVYGDPEEHPQSETYRGNLDPVGVRACYDESKRYGEMIAAVFYREHGLDVRIARLFNVYGPGMAQDDGRMIPAFICAALRGAPLPVHGEGKQTRSLCYVEDAIIGLRALMDAPQSAFHSLPHGGLPIINIGNPSETPVEAVARACWKAVREDDPRIAYVGGNPDDPRRRCPDIARARKILHWGPQIDLTEGLRRTAVWFRTQIA